MRLTAYLMMLAVPLGLASTPLLGAITQGESLSAFERADLPQWPRMPVKPKNHGLPQWALWTPVSVALDDRRSAALPASATKPHAVQRHAIQRKAVPIPPRRPYAWFKARPNMIVIDRPRPLGEQREGAIFVGGLY